MKSPIWLLDHRRNVYSQDGADGVLWKVLETLPDRNQWVVEFGAGDGLEHSNSRNLIESHDYSAVLIESDRREFEKLQDLYPPGGPAILMNKAVGWRQDDNLDAILARTNIPIDFDLLVIDVDGNDYHIWQHVLRYRPKVVMVEFNDTVPAQVRFVQKADPKIQQGASLSALAELGREKGYELVSVMQYNAVFVCREYYSRFEIGCNAPVVMQTDYHNVTYLFSGYDGTIFLAGSKQLPWHRVPLRTRKMQHMPWFLRKFNTRPTVLDRILWAAWVITCHPLDALKNLQCRIARRD